MLLKTKCVQLISPRKHNQLKIQAQDLHSQRITQTLHQVIKSLRE